MISLINSFLESNKFDNLNSFIARKIFKIFKIFFVKSKLEELPEQNYSINTEYLKSELLNGIKFKKIKDSIKYFSRLKRKIKKDIRNNGINKICAIIISLILDCGFRIGNKKYEKDNNSYGLTTLKKKHIFMEKKFIKIDFIGKKKVRNIAICKSKDIYKFFFEKLDNIDDEEYIFKYDDKCITSNDVNKYLYNFYKKFNLKITTKDLRTLNANTLFMKFFKLNINGKNPIKKAIEDTANKLHNTYAVCKKNYIDPEIIKMAENELLKK